MTGAVNSTPVFQEYTSTGTLVRTVTIPYSNAGSIAQDSAGNVYVYAYDTTYVLGIYNPQTGNWNDLTYSGPWSHDNTAGYEGLALDGQQYAYVNNQLNTSGPASGGVIRFNLSTGVGTDFNPMGSDTTGVTMGLDGNLYALGGDTVYELNPNTMALENTINLPYGDYRAIAVDASGDIYLGDWSGAVTCFNPSGTSLGSVTLSSSVQSMAIASDGTLAVALYYGSSVVQMTSTFTNMTTFSVPDGPPYLTFAQAAPPGPVSPAQSIVSCAATTLQSGTMTTEVTLTAHDANGLRENNGGLTVQFGLSGTAQGDFTSVTDHSDGTYTAYFTPTSPGSATVTATIGGLPVTSTLPSLTINPSPTAGNILVTLHPSSGSDTFEELTQAGAVIQSTTIPSVLGGAGNIAGDYEGDVYVSHGTIGVGDVAVYTAATSTWSALTSTAFGSFDGDVALDGNYLYTGSNGGGIGGIIRFDLTTGIGTDFDSSDGSLGKVTIGLDGNLYAIFGSSAVLEFDPITMNLLNTIDLPYNYYYGLAVNASGDIYATEYNLNVDEFNPAGVMINQAQAPSDVGQLVDLANGPDGSLLLTGNSGHVVHMTGALTLLSDLAPGGTVDGAAFQPLPIGPAAQDVFTTEPPANIGEGTAFGATVAVEDANGNTVPSYNGPVTISLASSANGGTVGGTTTVNAINGVATFTNLSRTVSGTCTLLATAGAFSTTSSSINVAPGAVSLSQSVLSVASVTDLSGVQDTVTFTAKDAYGTQETSGGLSVAFGQSGGTSTGSIGAVTDNNNGTYTATFTGVLAGSAITITATVGGSSLTSTLPTVTVVPGAVSLAHSIVTAAQPTIQSGNPDTVTLTARDAAGNQETSGGLTVAFGLGAGTSTGSFSVVTDHNNGIYTATFSGLLVGSGRTITATINSSAVTSTLPTIVVTPGPLSLAQSTVAIAPASIQSGSTATVTLTARDAAGNQEPGGGLTVLFGLGVGTSTGSFSAVTDHNNGTYTATFSGILAGNATPVTATIGGSAVSSTLPTITVTPGAISLSQTTLTVGSATLPSGTGDVITVTARDAHGNQENTGGATVVISLTGGTSTGTLSGVVDQGNGLYTASYLGILAGSALTVGATVNGSSITSASPTITVIAGAPSLAQSTVSIAPFTIQSGNTATVTLTARDAAGNQEPAGGLTVAFGLGSGVSTGTFGAVTDHGNGFYSAVFTGVLAGSARTITATIDGGVVTSALPTIVVTPGPVSLSQSIITLAPPTLQAGGTTTVTLLAKDSAGNAETGGGLAVTFGLGTAAISGSFSPLLDHNNGTYTSVFTAGATTGSDTVIGTIGSSAVVSAPTITVTPASVNLATSTIAIAPASVASGGSATVTLTARDVYGNQETSGGLAVVFGVGGGSATGSFSSVVDHGNGIYTASFTGIRAGGNTITATIGGGGVTSAAPSVTVTPGAVSLAQSTLSILPASIQSGSSATVTLTERDAAGNQETGGGLPVAFALATGTATGTLGTVTDDGNGTFTASFTGILVGTPRTISATIGGNAITSALPTITVTPGPFSVSQSTVSIAPPSIQAGTSTTITLIARDAAGNAETSGGLTVAFTLGSGSATGNISAVTDLGNGTYTAALTGLLAGTNTIHATINTQSVTSLAPTVTVTAGPFSLAQSIVSLTPASIQSGGSTTVTLTAKDAGGNPETSGGVSVVFGLGAGVSTGSFGPTIDDGNGTYTATFTGVLAGAARVITATMNGGAVTSALPSVTVTPGPVSLSQSTVSIAPTSIQSGNTAAVTLTARDAAGNQETSGGLTVAFTPGAGTSTGTFSNVTDNGNGTYSAVFTGVLAGTPLSIVAAIGGSPLTSGTPAISVTPGPLSLTQSIVTITPSTIPSGSAATVTLTAKDAAGNQEPTGGLAVGFGLGSGTSTGSFGAVVDHGDGTYTTTFTGIFAGTARALTATIGGGAVTSALPAITVTPGPISLTQSIVSLTPSSVPSGSAATVTLTTKDAAGNRETTGGLTVLFGLGIGTSTGAFSGVLDHHDGTYTATFTGVLAGAATPVTASIDGAPVSSAFPTITVTPGPVSLAQSTLSVGSAILASGNGDLITLTTRDAAGNQEASGGLGVAFSLAGGTSTGTLGAVTDHGNGIYTATFTGVLAGTALIASATIGGSSLTSAAPTITVTPGAVSVAQSTVSIAPANLQSGSSATVTLITRDAAGNPETSGGLPVTFGLGAGTATGAFTSVSDHGNGAYTVAFTGLLVGTNTIAAFINGQALTSPAPSVTVTPGPFSLASSTIVVSPSSVPAGSMTTVTFTARDAAGNQVPLAGLSVAFGLGAGNAGGTFGAVTDHNDGTYTANFTGINAGVSPINALVNGQPLTSVLSTVTVTPGPVDLAQSTVALFPSHVVSGTTAAAILTARDVYGNQESAGGLSVRFALGGGSATGSFSAVTDNQNGTYTAVFTASLDGANSIVGSIAGQPLASAAAPLTVTANGLSLSQSSITIASGSIASGTSALITLTTRDAAGNQLPVGGYPVTFALGAGAGTGGFGPVTDHGNGIYTATFTGVLAGANTIDATINFLSLTSAPAVIAVTPGPVSLAQSTVSISPATVSAGGSANVTLTARDAAGNVETSGGAGVTFSLGGAGATGTFSSIIDHGNGTYTTTFTGSGAGANTIVAAVGGQDLTSPAPVITVTPGPVSLSQSSVSIAPAAIPSGGATTVTLTARDALGNTEIGGGLNVAFSLGGGSATGSFTSLQDHGNGVYTAVFTGSLAGSNTIMASINNAAITAPPAAITVTPGPVSLSQSTVTISPGSITSGNAATVTLTARDAAGNQEASGGLTVTFGLSGGTATGAFSAVTDHNNGTYAATFTGVLAGSGAITADINGNAIALAPAITVTPGPFSVTQSTVSLAPGSVQSGGGTTVTLIARDAAGNQETSGGLNVAFAIGAGTATGSFTGLADHGNGAYTAAFTGVRAGVNTITAVVNGQALTSAAPTVTVTPGAFSLAQSIVSATPASVPSGSTAAITLTARDAAGNLETSGGLNVVFGLLGGNGSGAFSPVVDQHSGVYSATFTGVITGTTTLDATINGQIVTSTLPTITVTPGPVSLARSIISVNPASIQAGTSATVKLTAYDANGNLESAGGLNVAFQLGSGSASGALGAVTDNQNGTFTATFTGTSLGSNTITAAINGQAITTPPAAIAVTPGAVDLGRSIVTVAPATIAVGGTTTVTLTAEDAGGNQESSGGLAVAFQLGAGSVNGAFSNVIDHRNGVYTATFSAGSTAGAADITATINNSAITSGVPTLTVTPGPVSLGQSTLAISPASITSGNTATVTLTARDAAGNLETSGGLTVAFGLGGGAGTGAFSDVADHHNGVYTATVTGLLAGANTITASINGQPVTSTPAAIAVTPGPVSLARSVVAVSPASIPVLGTATVTLTLEDANGNRETSGGQSVAFGLTSGNSIGTFSRVTDEGNGAYTAIFSAGTTTGTAGITATIGNQAVTSAAPVVTVTPGPVSAAQSTISVSPAAILPDGAATVTLTAKDAFGNQEPTGGLAVAFVLGAGNLGGAFSQAIDHGDGTYTAMFTAGSAVGSSAITATINGQLVASTAQLTVTPGPVSLSRCIISVAPSSLAVGGTTTVTLAAVDAFGNPASDSGLNVTFALQAGAGSGSFGPVNDLGGGAFSAVFTGTVVGSNSITATINGQPVTSAPAAITVTTDPTTAALSAAPAGGAVFGQSLTLTATIAAPAPSLGTPTGTVSFYDGANLLGTQVLNGSGVATLSTSNLSVATHNLTIAYAGDAQFAASTGALAAFTVSPAATAIVVTASPGSSDIYGQAVALSATLNATSPSTASVSGGTVRFYIGAADASNLLGTASPVNGVATLQTSALPSNPSLTITAVYSGTMNFAGTTGALTGYAVATANTAVTLASSAPIAIVGQTVVFTATVSALPPSTATIRSGVVTFMDGTTTLGKSTLTGGNVAIFSTSSLTLTTTLSHSITASYADPLNNYAASVSTPVSQEILNPAATTTTLPPLGSSVFGQSVTFTATVSVTSAGARSLAGGAVAFKTGNATLGTGTLSPTGANTYVATFTPSTPLPVGSQSITASFIAFANFTASTSVARKLTVAAARTQTSVSSSAAVGDMFGQAVTFTATIAAQSPSVATPNVGAVSFYDGAAAPAHLLGTVALSAGAASYTTSALSVARHTITAVYSGASGFGSSSGAVAQPIAVADTLTSVASSAGAGSSFGQSVTFVANVTSTNSGAGAPTGVVGFYDGTTLLGKVPVNAFGGASFTTSSLAANPAHSITAVYSGNAHFGGSTSAALIQSVAPANTTVSLTQPAGAIVIGVPIIFTAKVSAASGGVPTGSVTFVIDDGLQTFTRNLAAGKATLQFAGFTTGGAHTIRVTYNPATGNLATSSSQTANVNVLAVATIALRSSSNPVFAGQSVTFTATLTGDAGSTPTGLVSFYDGATLLGTASIDADGEASITLGDLPVGTNAISAIYLGDQTYVHASTPVPFRQIVKA